MFMKVDLPEPDGPMIGANSPCAIAKVTSLNTGCGPASVSYCLCKLFTCTTALGPAGALIRMAAYETVADRAFPARADCPPARCDRRPLDRRSRLRCSGHL